MSDTGGMLDTYLICQALGWEWNLTPIIILTLIPFLIIGIIGFAFAFLDYWSKMR